MSTLRNILTGRGGALLVGILTLLLWQNVRQQFSGMAGWFFEPTVEGIKGLALYLTGDYDGAARAYRAHLRFDPRSAYGPPTEDYAAYARGNREAAKALADLALVKDPDDWNARLTLAGLAIEDNDLAHALPLLDQVLAQEKDQYDALLLTSIIQTRQGQYDKTMATLNRALRLNRTKMRLTTLLAAMETIGELDDRPRAEQPLCLMAHYYRYLRITDESNAGPALRYADRAIAANDHPSEAYSTKALIASTRLDYEDALGYALKATDIDPHNAYAFRIASGIYSDRGDLANEYRMRIGELNAAPDDDFFTAAAFQFLTEKTGNYVEGLALAKRLLARDRDNPTALARVGFFARLVGDDEEAVSYYRQAMERDPKNPELYARDGIGVSLENTGRYDDAMTSYKAAIALQPTNPDPHHSLAMLHWMRRHFDQAAEEYGQAVELGDRRVQTVAMLCQAHDRLGHYEIAAGCYEQVLAVDPNNGPVANQLGHMRKNLVLKAKQRR